MPRHHPSDDALMAYAAGSLPDPFALVVATHMAMCPLCCGTVAGHENLGGVLLDRLEPDAPTAGSCEQIFARLDEPDEAVVPEPSTDNGDPRLPQPLRVLSGSA